jgi:hypothetical protein
VHHKDFTKTQSTDQIRKETNLILHRMTHNYKLIIHLRNQKDLIHIELEMKLGGCTKKK